MTMYEWDHTTARTKVSLTHIYGCWERADGSEGGGLWLSSTLNVATGNRTYALEDYDGVAVLPQAIIADLRSFGITVEEEFQ